MSQIIIEEQLRPSTTSPEVLYSQPDTTTETVIQNIIIKNDDAAVITFKLYKDGDGTVADGTTIIHEDTIEGGGSARYEVPIGYSSGAVGSLSVESSVVDKVVFTMQGDEIAISVADAPFVDSFNFHIEAGENTTITLDESAAFAYSIDSLIAITSTGTIDVAIQINGVAITGINGVSLSSTQSTNSATALNDVIANQRVTLVLTNNSSSEDIAGTIKLSRA